MDRLERRRVVLYRETCALLTPNPNISYPPPKPIHIHTHFTYITTMLLKALPSSSIAASESFSAPLKFRASPCSLSRTARLPCYIRAGGAPVKESNLTGVVFQPFQEVQAQLAKVPPSCTQSLARQRFSAACESAINEQINVEYNASYVYHTLFAYFDRDNVALPGMAHFFRENSEEERGHAEKLMKYQNKRGGHVKLQSILMPSMNEFNDPEKGDALCAMELTLALEKLVNEKLLSLHKVATTEYDPQLADFIEGEFLQPQVEDIKKVAEYVSQLRRVGRGHGVYHFDLKLQGEAA